MYFRGTLALLLVVLLVTASGCTALPDPTKAASSRGSAGTSHAVLEPPSLPEQYTAKGPQSSGIGTPAKFSPIVTMQTGRPVLRSAAQTHISGSGLGANGTVNETNAQIVSYLTRDQDYTNQTIVADEINFWNGIAKIIQKKMDFTNATTVAFAQKAVRPADAGTYSVNQTSDLWEYSMPPNWTYNIGPNETSWDDDIHYASETIARNLTGDCDDFAVLLASGNIALGGNSRVIYAANPAGAHMYAEAQYPDTSFVQVIRSRYNLSGITQIYYHPANWLNLDWFNYPAAATYPGGKFYDDGGKIWVMYKEGTWQKLNKTPSGWDVILSGPI